MAKTARESSIETCWVCSASSGIWQEALRMAGPLSLFAGCLMLPLRAQEANPYLSGMEESFSAHRPGQMGLVPGDKSVPMKRQL